MAEKKSPKNTFDSVVVGAGMVGLSSALGLARLGLRVALIEGREPDLAPWSTAFDLRTSAINRATQNVFRHLGVWPAMQKLGVYPYQRMQVYDEAGSAQIQFDSAQVGQANLGHIVENRVMLDALWRHAKQDAHIQFFCPSQPRYIDRRDGSLSIDLGSQRLETPLLVAADGSNSWVRSHMGIVSQQGDYQQSALVATVKLELPHQDCAWQVFLEHGPLAFLPLRDNHCSIVWSTSSEHAAALCDMPTQAFNQALQAATGDRFGSLALQHRPGVFPLRYRHSQQYVLPNLALVGDAAHTIHPLAGQGVNLGILDAACLLQVIQQALTKKREYGVLPVLRQYERWRRGDNSIMLNSMSGINQLYRQRQAWLVQLRSAGLRFTDTLQPLKRFFIEQAMGLQSDLPELAQS